MIALTRPLTVFDLETTTAEPTTARIVQLAVVRLHPHGLRDTYETLVNPEEPIPPAATAIHGITDAMVAGKPTFRQLAPRLIRAFQGCDFLGYNIARFDLKVIGQEFKRAGIDTAVPEGAEPPRIIDAYTLWVKQEPRTLADAVRRFTQRTHDDAHAALADVEAALDVFEGQLAEWPTLPQTPAGLHDLLFPTNPDAIDAAGKFQWVGDVPTIAFGKHKGTALRDLDKGFLRWMLKTDFDEDTKAIARFVLEGSYPARKQPL